MNLERLENLARASMQALDAAADSKSLQVHSRAIQASRTFNNYVIMNSIDLVSIARAATDLSQALKWNCCCVDPYYEGPCHCDEKPDMNDLISKLHEAVEGGD